MLYANTIDKSRNRCCPSLYRNSDASMATQEIFKKVYAKKKTGNAFMKAGIHL